MTEIEDNISSGRINAIQKCNEGNRNNEKLIYLQYFCPIGTVYFFLF